jgi:hypothetical protein
MEKIAEWANAFVSGASWEGFYHDVAINLIQKIPSPSAGGDFRPTAILGTLHTILGKVLLLKIGPIAQSVAWNHFGLVPDRHAGEMVRMASLIFDKNYLFGKPVVWARLDVRKAFDSVKHEALHQALIAKEVPFPIARALIMQGRLARLSILRQSMCLGDTYNKWSREGAVWFLDDPQNQYFSCCLNALAWADDVVVCACSLAQVKVKLDQLVQALAEFGLCVKPGSLSWTASPVVSVERKDITLETPRGTETANKVGVGRLARS